MSEQNRVFELIGRLAWDRFDHAEKAEKQLAELGEANRQLMTLIDRLKAEIKELREKDAREQYAEAGVNDGH